MQIEVLKSKIHRAVITEANLHYVGSLTLDEDLMDAANGIHEQTASHHTPVPFFPGPWHFPGMVVDP